MISQPASGASRSDWVPIVKRAVATAMLALLAAEGCSSQTTARASRTCGVFKNDPVRPSRSGWVFGPCPPNSPQEPS